MLTGCGVRVHRGVLPAPAGCGKVRPSREVVHMAKSGRNDLCSCGSGKKFKKCHGIKTESQRQSRFLMIVVGGAVIAALAAVVGQMTTDRRGGAERVWDPAHGHYHVNGREVP